ncbi:OmpA family protein [Mucilaginibacter robiniae]|uniref:OmpA family protein n=1 Tax=Mucilaginibacter robiniae TaxID=2728022 RepID=A0A7L5E495_9SPHI|nr:OmpA family protein [Mucilaginibacter robiniae]QJD97905.1 OmpA family protein [Mucilaginibacter robiniae]
MKISKISYLLTAMALSAATMQSCKAKKAVTKPAPATTPAATTAPAPEKQPEPAPPAQPEPAPAPAKPDFNFSNIQFEFNSAVLKTSSYQILDKIAAEMKKDQAARFVLNGNSSAEGTVEHNMSLSVDRANSVKSYLVNAGINGDNLNVKGYGESKPLAPNTTEEGRELNRRVEVKLTK